jgi:hypothetical protein
MLKLKRLEQLAPEIFALVGADRELCSNRGQRFERSNGAEGRLSTAMFAL